MDVDELTLPPGHVLTTAVDPLLVSLGPGENLVDAGFGYVTVSSIGDTIWLDSDADGLYDAGSGELGVNGVLVALYQAGTLVDYTVTGYSPYTGEPGFYLFDTLSPGAYTLVVPGGNFDPGGALFGLEPTADLDGGLDNMVLVELGLGVDFRDADLGYQMSCGNGACQTGEDCGSCAVDCGACAPVCGNDACEPGEDCASCTGDCGLCPAVCGNGTCELDETCSSCAGDCGECPAVCGDLTCSADEDCASCSVDCGECPVAAPGTARVAYWKKHKSAWPVDKLVIGKKTYKKSDLVNILKHPIKKDFTYKLARQLIAAKLNVGVGNQSSCVEAAIAQADAWLKQHPVGSNVKGWSGAWAAAEPLRDVLANYNKGMLCAPKRK